MRTSKLRLNVEDLSVVAFATAESPGGRGTVRGHQETILDPSDGDPGTWRATCHHACISETGDTQTGNMSCLGTCVFC